MSPCTQADRLVEDQNDPELVGDLAERFDEILIEHYEAARAALQLADHPGDLCGVRAQYALGALPVVLREDNGVVDVGLRDAITVADRPRIGRPPRSLRLR